MPKPKVDKPRRANGEGSIYKYEARDIWRGSVTVGYYPNGRPKRKTVQGASEAIVKRKMKALLALVDSGYNDPGSMTVAQWLDRYYTIYVEPRIRSNTKQTYPRFISWWAEQIGVVKLSKLQLHHVQGAVNEIAKSKAESSVEAAKIFLKAAMKQAVAEELIRKNPVDGVKVFGRKTDRIKAVKEADIDKLASVWEQHRDGIVIPLLLETGMRIGELLALTWDDVDQEIRITKTQIHTPKNGHMVIEVCDTKTEKSNRTIPVTPNVANLISILRQRRNEDRLKAGQSWQENNLIIARANGAPITAILCRHNIKRLCLANGLPTINPHQLRHSYATRAITAGVNPRIVQELLGHSNINTTMSIYAEVEEKAKIEATQKITQMTAGSAMSNSVASALHPRGKK